MNRFCYVIFLLSFAATFAAFEANAQNRFTPVIQVGEDLITEFELSQRTRFLGLLRAPGDPRNLARDQLINESIQRRVATENGQLPSEEQLRAGLEEFAGRANLTAEEFATALSQEGVSPETFRNFISAGLAWRNHVQARFRGEARDISDEQVNRTLARTGTEGGLRVLVSEILLPATSAETTRASRERAAEIASLRTEEEFATAARLNSVSASRARGGELNWVAIDALPENVQSVIAALNPGQISRPVELENAIGIFLLRDEERVPEGSPETLTVDYALLTVPGGETAAAAIVALVDSCDDFYGIALDNSSSQLERASLPRGELAPDVRVAVAGLDENEASTALVRNGQATVLMLCSRQRALESTVDFQLVGSRLLNQKLGLIAADYLADLRADTYIADLVN